MNGNLELLKKISFFEEIKQVELDAEIEEKLGPEASKKARENSSKIFVYRYKYRSNGHLVIGFLIEPRQGTNLPCVVWNRGGSGDFGSIRIGALFSDDMAHLALNGYVVIASQYSGAGGSEGKDEFGGSDIQDVLILHDLITHYPRIDSSKIGMYGWSRGGLMTYLALTKVDWIKAAVVIAGEADEVSMVDFRPGWKEHQEKMYGGSLEEKIKRSPIYWPEKISKTTPILIMQGTADWRVNPASAIRLTEKLYKEKVPFRFIVFEGGDHQLTGFESEQERMVLEWFDRFLKKGEAIPDLRPRGK